MMNLETFKQRLKTHPALYEAARRAYYSVRNNKYINGFMFLLLLMVRHIPSHTIRNGVYRMMGLKLGKGSTIYGGAEIRSPREIIIGRNTIIGHNAILDGRGGLEIGDNVNFSTGVWVWTSQHDKNDPLFRDVKGKVVIEDYAWVSCRTIILPNTRIGRGAVVCAGAVATKDVEPYSIVAGVPARKIGERNSDLRYAFNSEDRIPFI